MDPLRIILTGNADLLKSSIVRQSKLTNNATISSHNPSKKEICFDFDYLEPRQGLSIEILYHGEDDFKIMGTIKGIPEGLHDMVEREDTQRKRFLIIRTSALSLLILLLLATLFLPELLPKLLLRDTLFTMHDFSIPILYVISLFISIYLFFHAFVNFYYVNPKVKPPKDLNE